MFSCMDYIPSPTSPTEHLQLSRENVQDRQQGWGILMESNSWRAGTFVRGYFPSTLRLLSLQLLCLHSNWCIQKQTLLFKSHSSPLSLLYPFLPQNPSRAVGAPTTPTVVTPPIAGGASGLPNPWLHFGLLLFPFL